MTLSSFSHLILSSPKEGSLFILIHVLSCLLSHILTGKTIHFPLPILQVSLLEGEAQTGLGELGEVL